MANKINPNEFKNFEVRELARQTAEIFHCVWGAKNDLAKRMEALEADIARRKSTTVEDERHGQVREVLKLMEDNGIGRDFFCGMHSNTANTVVITNARCLGKTINGMGTEDETGTRHIITGQIQKYHNLVRDKKNSKFYDPANPGKAGE